MNFPSNLHYTASHEWARVEPDGLITIGITSLAQDSLGELVYVELPALGRQFQPGESAAVVESTKAASDVYCPVAGEVTAVNESLSQNPQTVNESPYEQGWLYRIKPSQEAAKAVAALLNAEAYKAQAESNPS
jgi:glycine cleavage system H protein